MTDLIPDHVVTEAQRRALAAVEAAEDFAALKAGVLAWMRPQVEAQAVMEQERERDLALGRIW